MTIIHSRPGAQSLMYFVANATVNVATVNSTVDSDLVTAGAGDAGLVTGGAITKIAWSTDTGTITVKRGANVVFVLSGSSMWDLRQTGMVQDLYKAATLVVNATSANATLYIEVTKEVAGGSLNSGDH